MILLLSHDQLESSTDAVIDWLDHFGASYTRVNGADLLSADSWSLTLGKHAPLLQGLPDPKEVNVVWFRRWQRGSLLAPNQFVSEHTTDKLDRHLKREFGKLSQYLFSLYQQAYWLGDYKTADINKLQVLQTASEVGFAIPPTCISNSKEALTSFLEQYGRVIVKPIGDTDMFKQEDDGEHSMLTMYTEELTTEVLEQAPDHFSPTLCQARVDKLLEYRVFYLDGELYPMSIFSQGLEQTTTDFRKYSKERPNRRGLAAFGEETTARVRQLMQQLGLNTGSLDFIRSKTGELIFLEVNPVGQFGALSDYCNYEIEKRIAEFLIQKDHARQEIATRG